MVFTVQVRTDLLFNNLTPYFKLLAINAISQINIEMLNFWAEKHGGTLSNQLMKMMSKIIKTTIAVLFTVQGQTLL